MVSSGSEDRRPRIWNRATAAIWPIPRACQEGWAYILNGMNIRIVAQSVHTIGNKQHGYHLRVDRFLEICGIDSICVLDVSNRGACKNLENRVTYVAYMIGLRIGWRPH